MEIPKNCHECPLVNLCFRHNARNGDIACQEYHKKKPSSDWIYRSDVDIISRYIEKYFPKSDVYEAWERTKKHIVYR